MEWFVDTSGFYAFLCAEDGNHALAVELFVRAEAEGQGLITTTYVVHESTALIQGRLGWNALDLWLDEILPGCEVEGVDARLHEAGLTRWRMARQRRLSLTDCVSFEFMRRRRLSVALAFDEHFPAHGFALPA